MREAIRRFAREIIAQAEKAMKQGNEENGLFAKAVLLGRAQAFDFVLKELNEVIRRENDLSKQTIQVSIKENDSGRSHLRF